MFKFFKKKKFERKFDKKILRKNSISILIFDERWNSLFKYTEKTPDIIQCEEALKRLLKEQSRIFAESKEVSSRKKKWMEKILELTTEVYENNNEEAKTEMAACEEKIKKINDRAAIIETQLEEMPDLIKEANLELLVPTVNQVYFKMRDNQIRVNELERLIEEAHLKLKEYIDEKGTLSEDYTEIYSYFHDLLGAEELEKLDSEYFCVGKFE
jgi:hypothetical protein